MKKLTVILFIFVLLISTSAGCSNAKGGKQLTIENFIKALQSNGISIGKRSEKAYGLLMATDGYRIDVNDGSIEVYQFDTTIKSGKEAIEKWEKEGCMGHPVVVNKNLMMGSNEKHENWKEIIHVFNSL